ncbi:MAG: DUF3320 domain-containing protein, partial [Actinomycetota bacterium]|nr:DUF3320 domain-containing protein [Actinomycetota bacterium]
AGGTAVKFYELRDNLVKHLESVQGDERDVIIFSVGYGPDPEGRFTMNFGPLNKQGGRRRLNVAITRAREKVELVSSVRSGDFGLTGASSQGARLLRDYVQFAEQEAKVPLGEADHEEIGYSSPLEEEVARAVEALGYRAVPRVGVGAFRIDIAVRHPSEHGRFCLGIECDGDSYRATPTSRDRERLRQQVLAGLGWRIHRIWSLDWVRNRRVEIERLTEAIEAAASTTAFLPSLELESSAIVEERERVERSVDGLRDSFDAVELPWVKYYERVELHRESSYYDFHESINRSAQTQLLEQLIETEAPVHLDYAVRRLREAYGLERAGHRIVQAVKQSVNQAKRRGALEVRRGFLWRPDQVVSEVRTPAPDDDRTRREIGHVPPEEIRLAFSHLREASPGAEDDRLLVQVARILGFDHAGPRIKKALLGELRAMRRADSETPR